MIGRGMLITYTFELELSAEISSAILVKVYGSDESDCISIASEYLASLDIKIGKCMDTHIIRDDRKGV